MNGTATPQEAQDYDQVCHDGPLPPDPFAAPTVGDDETQLDAFGADTELPEQAVARVIAEQGLTLAQVAKEAWINAAVLSTLIKGTYAGDKDAQRTLAALNKVRAVLDLAHPAHTADLDSAEKALLRPFFLLTMKPNMYVANVAEHGFENNPMLDRVREHAAREGAPRPTARRARRPG